MTSPSSQPHGKVLMTGASGLIGRALSARLRAGGREVVELAHKPREGAMVWHPVRGELPGEAWDGVDTVIHLAGENIGQRWSHEVKKQIRESRVASTRLLAERMAALPSEKRPRMFLAASAVGYYGVQRKDVVDEGSATGSGFLAEVTREWEAASKPAADAGIRVANARLGVVLSHHGGALAKLLSVFNSGMAGPAGPGTQRMSWVGLSDAEEILLFLLAHEALQGPVNVVAPQACTNQEMVELMGRLLRKPAKMHAPAFMLKMMLGEVANETLLADLAVRPKRLQESGYNWRHADLEAALRHELGAQIPQGV